MSNGSLDLIRNLMTKNSDYSSESLLLQRKWMKPNSLLAALTLTGVGFFYGFSILV